MATIPARKIRRPRIGKRSNGMLMTPQEFDAVDDYDELYRYELIHGILIVSPFASRAERDPNEELGHWLRSYKEDHPQGSALDRTLFEEYVQLPDSRRRADRLIWTGLGRVPDPEKALPTIAVEFVSKSTRDRVRDDVEKRREYFELGVLEYWVIDRYQRKLTVFRRPPAEPAEQVYDEKVVYTTPLLPGFELPLARLLNLADDWKRRPRTK
jgi:Uma2 family endonuclease